MHIIFEQSHVCTFYLDSLLLAAVLDSWILGVVHTPPHSSAGVSVPYATPNAVELPLSHLWYDHHDSWPDILVPTPPELESSRRLSCVKPN